ncbi:secreted protein [Deinococcus marmoris]|uniref:Secreted protein n=1 Tax=Deinococcus marmoris TaxID=249408 RepID=A0A1U7P2N1_9DEIO|nr:secreted protein [Deinococcus marmoris]
MGKSSVAHALLQHYPRGLHLPVDDLRELVVSGLVHPSLDSPPEATRQFALARRAAAFHARLYAEAGFAVVVDDVLWPTDLEAMRVHWATQEGQELDVRPVFLCPTLEVTQARNAARVGKAFDTLNLVPMIAALHPSMPPADYRAAGWRVLDTSNLNIEQTVELLLA